MTFVIFSIGLVASAFIVSLTLLKTQKSITIVSIILGLTVMLQYYLLKQSTAMYLNGLSVVFGVLTLYSLFATNRLASLIQSTTTKMILVGLYVAVFFALNGGFKLDIQLLACLGSVLMVAVMFVKNPWTVKAILFAAGVCWTVFQFNIGAYGNLVGQGFYFAGILWSALALMRNSASSKDVTKTLSSTVNIAPVKDSSSLSLRST